jgi:BirA family transcriptional regulator, biotin operon repressor / biotin---[acetyl-CoA-carboxylase] ligase
MSSTFPVIEPLEVKKIRSQVLGSHVTRLSQLEIFDVIDSTNQYLLQRSRSENTSGVFCFAEQQTQGRGRLGREWYSPRGANIYCSVAWRFPVAINLSALSLAVAVILGEVLHKYGVTADIEFKWPNDIIFSGGKLAGILLESLPEKNGEKVVVIGVGINLQLPESVKVENNWMDVATLTDAPLQRNLFAGILVDELLKQLIIFEQKGFAAFIERWRDRDILNRRNVIVQMSKETIAGISQGIDENGALLVELSDGSMRKFQNGEVSVRY